MYKDGEYLKDANSLLRLRKWIELVKERDKFFSSMGLKIITTESKGKFLLSLSWRKRMEGSVGRIDPRSALMKSTYIVIRELADWFVTDKKVKNLWYFLFKCIIKYSKYYILLD